jgi:translation initiation factor IF-2
VLGFESTPQVGEIFKIFTKIEEAQQNVEKEEKKSMTEEAFSIGPDQKVLNIILKADVQGSLEAIEEIFKTLPQEKIVLRILKKEVGDINESDVKLAASSKAKIVGFRVKKGKIASDIEEQLKAKAVVFDIIYELVQSVRFLMEKLVSPEDVKNIIGRMKILGIFHKEGSRKTIGGKVIEGEIRQGLKTEILRDDEKIGEGRIINLQRNKKDTDKISKGEEGGLLYEFSGEIREGDVLIAFVEEKLKGEL